MADIKTKEERIRNMAAIRSKDAKPEMLVRRFLHAVGYRYRSHDRKLPGCPDFVNIHNHTDSRTCYPFAEAAEPETP